LLAIFEQICQTLAYAHSKRVIHRDLKPGNVMVGAFGEVQVMDWGLAKVLAHEPSRTDVTRSSVPAESVMPARNDDPMSYSRAGDVLGTYSYMAPEQACGAVEQLDERCDVFGLGAVLCEVLTGQPPYTGPTVAVLRDRAVRAELGPALARLESCGADKELVELSMRCLSVEPAQRPCNAGQVAQAVSAYLEGVQERLRESERQRAAAEARAVETAARAKAERRARRLLLGLAAAVLVATLGGGVAAWQVQQQRAIAQVRRLQTDQEVHGILERGRAALADGWQRHDLEKLREAAAEALRAADIAHKGDARPEVQEQVAAFKTEAAEHLRRAERNRALMDALLNVSAPRETQR
jgi:serine/threonine-protein kinase